MIRIDGASGIASIDRVAAADRRADFAAQLRDAASRRAPASTARAITSRNDAAATPRDRAIDDSGAANRDDDDNRDDAANGHDDGANVATADRGQARRNPGDVTNQRDGSVHANRRDATDDVDSRLDVANRRDVRGNRPAPTNRGDATPGRIRRDATAARPAHAAANRPAPTESRGADAPAQPTTDPDTRGPVAAATTDAIAAGATEIAVAGTPAPAATTAAATTAIAAADAAADAVLPELPLTPLEQAVHDLLVSVPSHDAFDAGDAPDLAIPSDDAAPSSTAIPGYTPDRDALADAPTEAPPVIEVRAPVELPAPTSHVHLVVGDDADRVVVTLAVRGNAVNVAIRGDDHTAAALARNAGSLDHAMRARGLDLASFAADPDSEPPRRHHNHREREPSRDAPFVLEDKP